MRSPLITVIAGPNGAGKSTAAPALIPKGTPYINADEIAKMLPGPGKDVQASRILLETWDTLAAQKASFAVETTLASRSLAPRIRALKEQGYAFHLYSFWLPDVELSIARVAERVRNGGHDIPEETIRRRYASGVKNFFELYQGLADKWRCYHNVNPDRPRAIAAGEDIQGIRIFKPELWTQVRGERPMADHGMEEDLAEDHDLRMEAQRLRKAFRAAILEHKRNGNPICTWRDGKVVWIQPEDIDVDVDYDELN